MWRVSTVLNLSGLSTQHQFSQPARGRGTAVHDYVEAKALKKEAIVYANEHEPYIVACDQWFADFKPKVLFTERRVVSKQKRCTGRIDLGVIVEMALGEHVIVDVKTGSQADWHGIQVAGYCDLANDDPELTNLLLKHTFGPWSRAILYLQDNGKYKWHGPLELLQRGPQDTYLWRSALALIQWRFDHGMLSITDPENPDDDRQPLTVTV